MAGYPFGNDPAKVHRYRAFWDRSDVSRPLVGFSIKSWFPLQEFEASRGWEGHRHLTPEMIHPPAFLDDQERLLREGETLEDDILRGASPSQAVPWLCAMLGSKLRILPGNVLAEEQHLPWDQVLGMSLDTTNPWYRTYLAFIDALHERAAGRFPVTHGTLIGPTDLLAAFRGHSDSIVDLLESPDEAARALDRYADIFQDITEAAWAHSSPFLDGYFDAQYQLWAPGTIARMQEDAVAVYSPDLYRKFVQPVDRRLAEHFETPFMHLHSTSMHVLDLILEIDALRCLQVNYELHSGGPDVRGMLPYFRTIQEAGRSLIIRGSFTEEEARVLADSLDPRGLYIYVMVESVAETESLRRIFGM